MNIRGGDDMNIQTAIAAIRAERNRVAAQLTALDATLEAAQAIHEHERRRRRPVTAPKGVVAVARTAFKHRGGWPKGRKRGHRVNGPETMPVTVPKGASLAAVADAG